MRKYWILIIFLSIIVIGLAIWFFAPTSLNMHMAAYQISADGTVEQSYPITIQGKIKEKNDRLYASLDIDFPEDFRYSFINPERSGNIAYAKKESKAGKVIEFAVNDDTYDKETNWTSACYYVVNTKLGYFLAYWPEDGTLVLAATDSNVEVSDLVAYYDGYIQSLVYSDEQDNGNAGHEPTEQTTQIDWTMYGTEVNIHMPCFLIDEHARQILGETAFTIQGSLQADGQLDGYMLLDAYPIPKEAFSQYPASVSYPREDMVIYSCQVLGLFPEYDTYYNVFTFRDQPDLMVIYIAKDGELITAICAESEAEVWENWDRYLQAYAYGPDGTQSAS